MIGEHIQIHTQLKAEIGRLKADPSQLEQVLLNLCVNARDAMPKGGSITIQTADVTYFLDDFYSVNEMPAGEYVKLTVTDTGTGMTPEVKKHIFEPFFTTKEKGQGTGLGPGDLLRHRETERRLHHRGQRGGRRARLLPSICRAWMRAGEKSSMRKEVGQLPGGQRDGALRGGRNHRAQPHRARPAAARLHRAGGGRRQAGARRRRERNGGREIDLLFSDVVLPDAGGQELARLDSRDAQWPDEAALHLRLRGRKHSHAGTAWTIDTAFLQKPFTPADLAKKVREVLDEPAGIGACQRSANP